MPHYTKAPIQEIVCEFRFEPGQPWDIAQPGLVYEKLRERFPKRKQVQNIAVTLEVTKFPTVTKTPRVQFLQNDEKVLVQVAENLLAINRLPPYDNWGNFRPVIDLALKAYVEVTQPKAISRIGLRYINHFRLPEQTVKLEEYFQVHPEFPDSFGQCLDFDVNLAFEGGTPSDVLGLHFGSIPAETGTAFVLDFDHFTRGEKPIPLNEVDQWLESAHRKVDDTFETCITDKMKELLK